MKNAPWKRKRSFYSEDNIVDHRGRESKMEMKEYRRRGLPFTEEEEVQLELYIDLLTGRNINHYKKVTKAISEGFEKPVQDVVREIFRRAVVERNIVKGRM